MDEKRFDSLTKMLGRGASRRSVLKGLLGLGGAAVTATVAEDSTEARTLSLTRIPTPLPPTCPSGQQLCGGTTTEFCCPYGRCFDGHCCPYDGTDWCGTACCGEGQCTDTGECCPDGYDVCRTICCPPPDGVGPGGQTTLCSRAGNTDFCCDGGRTPCGLDCCAEFDQCCDGECCPAESLCLARVFGEGTFVEEERCCPIEQTCDSQCCTGTCFDPLPSQPAADPIERTCCPAEGVLCTSGGRAACCQGETPQCCSRDSDEPPLCLPADACCLDSDCTDLNDPTQCAVGICDLSTNSCATETVCTGQTPICCVGGNNTCCFNNSCNAAGVCCGSSIPCADDCCDGINETCCGGTTCCLFAQCNAAGECCGEGYVSCGNDCCHIATQICDDDGVCACIGPDDTVFCEDLGMCVEGDCCADADCGVSNACSAFTCVDHLCREQISKCQIIDACTPPECDLINGCPTASSCPVGWTCCDDGMCVDLRIPGSCCTNIPCPFIDACTPGECVQGTGCPTASSCPVGWTCCDDGMCVDFRIGGCCTSAQCNDGNACTADSCNPQTHICSHIPIICLGDPCSPTPVCNPQTGCPPSACAATGQVCCNDGFCRASCGCTSDTECNDNNACTADTCNLANGQCVNTPIVCDDGDPCTTSSCDPVSGCTHVAIPGCCTSNDQCVGLTNPATCVQGVCSNNTCTPQAICTALPCCGDGTCGFPDGELDTGPACTSSSQCCEGCCIDADLTFQTLEAICAAAFPLSSVLQAECVNFITEQQIFDVCAVNQIVTHPGLFPNNISILPCLP